MRTRTRIRLLQTAGLVLTLPIWLLLFVLAISLDVGPFLGLLVVYVPLGLLAAGIVMLVRGAGVDDEDSGGVTGNDSTNGLT